MPMTGGQKPRFVPQPKLYRLTFDGTDWAGLEATLSRLNLGEILSVQSIDTSTNAGTKELFTLLANHLVEWNVSRPDGSDVPTTYEGVEEQDIEMLMALMSAWVEATTNVSDDLGKASTSGPTSDEESIPTVTRSNSPTDPSFASLAS